MKKETPKQLVARKLKDQKDSFARSLAMQVKAYENKVVSYSKRVQAGIKWLNANAPQKKEWHKSIDLQTLNLSQGNTCVCGQVFEQMADGWANGYSYVTDRLESEKRGNLGFSEVNEVSENYDLLTATWYEAIKELRKKK